MKKTALLVLFLLLVNFLVWYAVFCEDRGGILTVAFLDVGQGDAIFIDAPNGNQILLDGGPDRKVLTALGRVMPFYDRSIDLLVASHPDADHIGGLVDVLERFRVGAILEPELEPETQVYQRLAALVSQKGVELINPLRGTRVDLGSGIFLEILSPDRSPLGWDPNDASLVARLVDGPTSFLLTGDAPAKIERYLASLDGNRLHSDVLKASHHGSRTSTAEEFLGAVRPKYVVISVGANNRYGHPHSEVLDRLAQFDTEILQTSESGDIIFESDGQGLRSVASP